MSDKAELYAKLSDAVEALEELGLDIEEAEVAEAQRPGSQNGHPLMQMMGGAEPETVNVLHIIATVDDDGPKQEHPDSGEMDPENAVEIELEDDGPEADVS